MAVELLGLCLVVLLCLMCAKSDIKNGVVPNKLLKLFLGTAVLYDVVYYGIIAPELTGIFLFNVVVVSSISLVLFYTHSFAGGDCKMAIVLSLLFPAGCYWNIRGTSFTLTASLVFSLAFGYIFLLANSLLLVAKKKVTISLEYIGNALWSFSKSYFAALTYIAAIGELALACGLFRYNVGVWIVRIASAAIALSVPRLRLLKKGVCILPVAIAVGVISVGSSSVPILLSFGSIVRTLVLFLCQATIRTTIYDCIKVEDLKEGMILAAIPSMLMQSSITPGLPGVSTEDLRSRLTSDEVASIHLWAKATKTENITIVKKVPFAALLGVGFLAYAAMGVSQWA